MARAKKREETKGNAVINKLKRQAESFESIITEINRQYREIEIGAEPENKTLRIRWPNLETEEKISRAYAKEYGKMLNDPDMKTQEELLAIMEKRNVWGPDKENKIEQLKEKVTFLSRQLLDKGNEFSSEELEDLANQYETVVGELNVLSSKKGSIIENSIENRANELKIKLQLVECVFEVDKNGKESKFWKNLEEINSEDRRIMLNRIVNESLSFWNGVPSNFLENLPDLQSGSKDTETQKNAEQESSQNQLQSGPQLD